MKSAACHNAIRNCPSPEASKQALQQASSERSLIRIEEPGTEMTTNECGRDTIQWPSAAQALRKDSSAAMEIPGGESRPIDYGVVLEITMDCVSASATSRSRPLENRISWYSWKARSLS